MKDLINFGDKLPRVGQIINLFRPPGASIVSCEDTKGCSSEKRWEVDNLVADGDFWFRCTKCNRLISLHANVKEKYNWKSCD